MKHGDLPFEVTGGSGCYKISTHTLLRNDGEKERARERERAMLTLPSRWVTPTPQPLFVSVLSLPRMEWPNPSPDDLMGLLRVIMPPKLQLLALLAFAVAMFFLENQIQKLEESRGKLGKLKRSRRNAAPKRDRSTVWGGARAERCGRALIVVHVGQLETRAAPHPSSMLRLVPQKMAHSLSLFTDAGDAELCMTDRNIFYSA